MTLMIADTHNTGVLTVRQTNELGSGALYLNHDEQRELMESLARIHGFSIVDREERKELFSLVKEADEAKYENQELTALAALAAAVSSALRFENDKEV